MLNLLSWLLGLVTLALMIPAWLPLLGWANWLLIPIALLGVILGAISSRNGGRNFCLIVAILGIIRLSIGGGLL